MKDSLEMLIGDLDKAGAAISNEYAPCAYFGAAPTRCRDAASGHQCPAFDATADPCAAIMAKDAAERIKAILTEEDR